MKNLFPQFQSLMPSPTRWIGFVAMLAVSALSAAQEVATTPVARVKYDLNYSVSDDRIQVFDDGFVTRLLLPEGTLIPLVVSMRPQGEVLQELRKAPPYLVIEGLHAKLVLNWANQRKVAIQYTGAQALAERAGQPVAFGATKTFQAYGRAQPPVSAVPLAPADARRLATAESAPGLPVFVDGKQGTVALETAQTPPPAPIPPKRWEIQQSDGLLSRALRRWAKDTGKLLFWGETTKEIQAIPAVYEGEFMDVLTQLMQDSARSTYPLQVCVFSNAVRILHVTQICEK